jgi:hypothetical protein
MEPTPLKELKFAEAKELAELLLLQHDVQASIAAMEIWGAKYAEKELSGEDTIIAAALFRDAIVQFMGCFDTSAQFKLRQDVVYAGVDGGPEYFQWLKDIRDAYAAHKFGRLRQAVVGANLIGEHLDIGHDRHLSRAVRQRGGAPNSCLHGHLCAVSRNPNPGSNRRGLSLGPKDAGRPTS